MKKVYCEIFFIVCIPYDSHLPKMCEQMALSFTERSQHIQKQAALTVLRSYFSFLSHISICTKLQQRLERQEVLLIMQSLHTLCIWKFRSPQEE